MEFKGRTADLDVLGRVIDDIEGGAGATRGRAVIVTGRRRVGKSRLVQDFCDRAQLPYMVFQATRGRNPVAERSDFTAALAASGLPEAVAGPRAGDWNQALRVLALAVPDDTPSIAVLDEIPWLAEQDRE